MSYKSLLFCPDEKAARLVAQVLSELEFTVTLADDAQQAAQRLADEHFDALVVDIANEQDAALLFKSARDSEVNHSALSVAVVEGQAGVAKAFRIGGNLVLTKPINIEQSKGTLRVARGLLRKNETKTPAATTKPAPAAPAPFSSAPVPQAIAPSAPTFSAPAIPASQLAQQAANAADGPFSRLEVEDEPAPAPEAAEVALLESMPDPTGAKPVSVEQTWTPKLKASAEPIAASTGSSAGAAVAPALEKPATEMKPAVEIKPAAPLASQEPITADFGVKETFEAAAVPVPNFSYSQDSGNTKKIVKTFVMLVLFAVAGYMAWQRFQLGQYLANLKGSSSTSAEQVQSAADSSPSVPSPKLEAAKQAPDSEPGLVFPEAPTSTDDSTPPPAKSAERSPSSESIQVDELSSTPEPQITVTAKPQPLVVKNGSKIKVTPKVAQPAPPALSLAASSPASNDALANVVTSSAPLPTLKVLRVSQGVSQGLLIKKVAPVYPAAALQMHKHGAVELLAKVAKDGSIASIQVLSGDPALSKAATDAVKQWKYRPYLLNGEPVEIETQITVNFNARN
jgi:periplasmic protein TonB